jgi:hypothetical protein
VLKFQSHNLIGDRASNDLLECLRHNSLFTQEASERFSHQLEKYKMVSFFETLPMKLGMKGIADVRFHIYCLHAKVTDE